MGFDPNYSQFYDDCQFQIVQTRYAYAASAGAARHLSLSFPRMVGAGSDDSDVRESHCWLVATDRPVDDADAVRLYLAP